MKLLAVAIASLSIAVSAQAADWRALDPENGLVIDTTKGRIIIEMVPEAAPKQVARVKELARAGFYDGLIFHRVIGDFMAQTGDPLGTGQGGSTLPDLAAEFTFKRGPSSPVVMVTNSRPNQVGYLKSLPVLTEAV